MSDKDILRRIAERGMKLAHQYDKRFVDIFQHLLDEIQRLFEEMK
jgi:deoxyadenosine/deoxycytidine kinase